MSHPFAYKAFMETHFPTAENMIQANNTQTCVEWVKLCIDDGHMTACQGPQGNFQVQVIALPLGAPPPQGTILAAGLSPPAGSEQFQAGTEQFQAMNEIFPQGLCQVANSGNKFRIINPSTGEEVQAPTESDKISKRLPILNPGTGKEVLPGNVPADNEKENVESGVTLEEHPPSTKDANSNNVLEDENSKPVGVSWDWPLSRHEIRERIVQLEH